MKQTDNISTIYKQQKQAFLRITLNRVALLDAVPSNMAIDKTVILKQSNFSSTSAAEFKLHFPHQTNKAKML